MKSCHRAATGSQHKEEVYAQEGKWPLSPCSLPKCHLAQMVYTNTAHLDDHSSCPTSRSIYPPKKWGKIISGTRDMAVRQSRKISLGRSSLLQSCEYVKGNTDNNITGNFITRKVQLLLVMWDHIKNSHPWVPKCSEPDLSPPHQSDFGTMNIEVKQLQLVYSGCCDLAGGMRSVSASLKAVTSPSPLLHDSLGPTFISLQAPMSSSP